jgi:hypothetical protein
VKGFCVQLLHITVTGSTSDQSQIILMRKILALEVGVAIGAGEYAVNRGRKPVCIHMDGNGSAFAGSSERVVLMTEHAVFGSLPVRRGVENDCGGKAQEEINQFHKKNCPRGLYIINLASHNSPKHMHDEHHNALGNEQHLTMVVSLAPKPEDSDMKRLFKIYIIHKRFGALTLVKSRLCRHIACSS